MMKMLPPQLESESANPLFAGHGIATKAFSTLFNFCLRYVVLMWKPISSMISTFRAEAIIGKLVTVMFANGLKSFLKGHVCKKTKC